MSQKQNEEQRDREGKRERKNKTKTHATKRDGGENGGRTERERAEKGRESR